MKKYDLEYMKSFYNAHGVKYKEFKKFYITIGSYKTFKKRCELNIFENIGYVIGGLVGIIGQPIVFIFNFIPRIRLKR